MMKQWLESKKDAQREYLMFCTRSSALLEGALESMQREREVLIVKYKPTCPLGTGELEEILASCPICFKGYFSVSDFFLKNDLKSSRCSLFSRYNLG